MSDRTELIGEIRRFNRFYTRTTGLLEETLTASPYTLTEARVLFELGHRTSRAAPQFAGEQEFAASATVLSAGPAASEIAEELRLDPAYLTRILRKFEAAGLIDVRADPADGRRRIIALTASGEAELGELQAAANKDVARLIQSLPDEKLHELSHALQKTAELLGGPAREKPQLILRPHRAGDVGWVVYRQAVLYAEEYGWDLTYEALVAEIGASFIRNFVPGKEFCWIAELDGVRAGAVFLVRKSEEEAQLRLLHVEREARGLGIGSKLVAQCMETARRVGYRKMVLWTNDVLADARRIYERAGFKLVSEERHHSFGKDLNGQFWELAL
ncbi:helix-turn-helix domain-containing GNAT family N-acetyltransferase [Mesorhizobium sp. BAC0120]|uniref:bifunctional helix-turn-helix transcriptional regulator/GNAT family N-acetyltransferase n=1 Tax=Mesorhizobium sp. BAC0120 TaxID=3090670 RepID=UPI00298CCA6D|nr:helix-turn-helix domain-containing GNAT family N-acetyltransferase [Mesorhizobium sp. BAC0120]MDW6021183.1 helix-turn-helix domain-containing GNAT family N-acetyltransferase [Mesorhizobium sp. BAC0120]